MAGSGRGLALGKGCGLLDQGLDLGLDLVDLGLRRVAARQRAVPEQLERVARRQATSSCGAVAGIAHAFGVGTNAVGPAFDQGRPAARACAATASPRRLVDGQHVVAVHRQPGMP